MNEHTWWYLSRASGMVAWVLMGATCLWGILLVTRMLKPADRPAWLLDLHRHLATLSILTVAGHLAALVADNNPYVAPFGWSALFIPQGSKWEPVAVTWGVISMYLLVLVQLTSLIMKKLPKKFWRAIHLTSYVSFGAATVHGFMAGSDSANVAFLVVGSAAIGIVVFALIARILQARAKRLP